MCNYFEIINSTLYAKVLKDLKLILSSKLYFNLKDERKSWHPRKTLSDKAF